MAAYLDLSTRRRFVLALAAGLATHGLLLGALGAAARLNPTPATTPVIDAPLVPIELVAEEANREPVRGQQFVDLPPPEREIVPTEARFADRFNRAVERETVNRADLGELGQPGSREQSAEPPGSEAEAAQLRASAGEETGPEAGELGPEFEGTDDREARATPRRSLGAFAAAAGVENPGGGITDFLEVEEGDRTMVNSTRSIYYSFFNRMRNRIQSEWNPNRAYALNDPTGQALAQKDQRTLVNVVLLADGSVESVRVDRASDWDFLDREATRAVRAAGPYTNVPEGLKDEDGRVRITWQFIFTFSDSPRVMRFE